MSAQCNKSERLSHDENTQWRIIGRQSLQIAPETLEMTQRNPIRAYSIAGKGHLISSTRPDRGAPRNWLVCGEKRKNKNEFNPRNVKVRKFRNRKNKIEN